MHYSFLSFFVLFFWLIIEHQIYTDIQLHVEILINNLNDKTTPFPPLYYYLIYFFAFFSNDVAHLSSSSIVMLAFFVALKYYFTGRYLMSALNSNSDFKIYLFLLVAVTFATPALYFNIYEPMYLGKISPNVFHNSTTIMVMPFSLLLWWSLLRFFEGKPSSIYLMILLCIISILIKPSYVMAFIPMIFLIFGYGLWSNNEHYIRLWRLVFLASLCVLLLYFWIFVTRSKGNSVEFNFMGFYNHYSKNLVKDFFLSLLFPLVVFSMYCKSLLINRRVVISLCIFIFGLIIAVSLEEVGGRSMHGNFTWGAIISLYILFMELSYFLLSVQDKNSLKFKICLIALSFHLLSGLLYVFKFIFLGSYF